MYKLLIVDDEPRIRNGLAHSLNWKALDFDEIRIASNGKQAFEIVKEYMPDLVITDIRMPEMDGLQMLEAINDLGISTKVIIISGYNDFLYAQKAIHVGVCEYILKPIQEDLLLSSVKRIINELNKMRDEDQQIRALSTSTANETANKAIKYIEDNYMHNIALTDVANNVSVHPSYLSALLSKYCGKGFAKILTEVRIAKAKELLKKPGVKIYEVSEEVGYMDYSWFSKTFKQVEGVSPKQYIKQYHSDPKTYDTCD